MAASCITLPGGHLGPQSEAGPASGFAQLDELARRSAVGFSLVHVSDVSVAGSIARHVRRLVVNGGRRAICVDGVDVAEPWREVAKRLNVTASEPNTVATQILARANDAAIIVCSDAVTAWGAAVSDALAALLEEERPKAWLVEIARARRSVHGDPLTVADPLVQADVDRFWQALLGEDRRVARPGHDRVEALERAWWSARGAPSVERTLTAAARVALRRLKAVGGSLDAERQARLGVVDVKEELVASGLVAADASGRVWLCSDTGGVADRTDACAVAAELMRGDDPWEGVRAAELLASVDEHSSAVRSAERALRQADASAREDLWHRTERALASSTTDGSTENGVDAESAPAEASIVDGWLRLSSLALELGDVEPALRLARGAAHHTDGGENRHAASILALGRATAARGDLDAAKGMLESAIEVSSGETRRRATVELAEVLCASGELDRAHALALEVIDAPSTQLSARNVVGKLLMARREWDEAEKAFATDADVAATLGDAEAELRALLNRATSLVGGGRRGEARTLLASILDRADRAGSARAKAFALSNLAVLASRRHDYADALRFREQAIVAFRRIGNRKWLARSMIYLADLRIDLGLVAEAEQALAFAKRVLGPNVPPTQAAWLGLVLSRIHLERGHVARAAEEIDSALCSAERSTDGTMLLDCRCFAARVALADGDQGRAAAALMRAKEERGASADVEIALLEACLREASGEAFVDEARCALMTARAAKDRARTIEAHQLLSRALLAADDAERAAVERAAAKKLREAIAATLPPGLRARYTQRRDRIDQQAEILIPETATAAGPRSRRQRRPARHGMIGSHPAMLRMFDVLDKVAGTDDTVLVLGESGTGKELVADALHRQSARSTGPIVKVNCAALVETLLLSELFGHEKGAFTGATSQRRGCFEHADGGTIFLDEIGDISPATQAALLRVLQDRTFHRVGGTDAVSVDVRVVCATHRDLRAMVDAGSFREDLYYRLSGMVVPVPPLRERLDDLPLLASEILLRMSRRNDGPLKRLSPEALELLASHRWPGNVRELENVLRAVALFSAEDLISDEDVRCHAASLKHLSAKPDADEAPQTVRAAGSAAAAPAESNAAHSHIASEAPLSGEVLPEDAVYAAVRGGAGLRELQKRLEQECIVRALRETDGHVTRAAALLGIKRPRLSQLIKQHNLRTAEGDGS